MESNTSPTSSATVRHAYRGIEGLDAAADAVQSTLDSPGWAILMELLASQKGAIDRKLRGASVPLPQADYAMWHGRLDGMAAVQDLATTLIARRDQVIAEQAAKHEGERAESRTPVRS